MLQGTVDTPPEQSRLLYLHQPGGGCLRVLPSALRGVVAHKEATWSQGSTVKALKLITLLACTGLFYASRLPVLSFGQRHESH